MKLNSALSKISALNGVRAALVFDHMLNIVARNVPKQYSNEVLKHIATQLYQLSQHSKRANMTTREFRLAYERYAVYLRCFSRYYYLVVFMDNSIKPADFRQPLNLAVLVLEKALRNSEVTENLNPLAAVAQVAENYLREKQEKDETFAGKFRELCARILGETGREIVDFVVEDEVLVLPLKQESDMRRLREKTLEQVIHPLKQQLLDRDSDELLRRCLAVMV